MKVSKFNKPKVRGLINLGDLKITQKLMGLLAGLMIGFLIIGVAYYRVLDTQRQAIDISNKMTQFENGIHEVQVDLLNARRSESEFYLNKYPIFLGNFDTRIVVASQNLKALAPGLAPAPATAAIQKPARNQINPLGVTVGRFVKGTTAAQMRAIVTAAGGAKTWPLGLVLAELGRRGIAALLVEGGSGVFTAFIEGGLADKAVLTLSPRFVGGASAPGLIGGAGVDRIAAAFTLRNVRSFTVEDDLVLEGYF